MHDVLKEKTSDLQDNDLVTSLLRRADKLKSKRASTFDPAWQEISQYYYPDMSDINTEKEEGTTGWFDRIYESTPIRAASTCSIGVRNWVTPSTDPWLALMPPNYLPKGRQQMKASPRVRRILGANEQEDENGQDEATRYLAGTAEEFQHELQTSNFYAIIQPFNRGACVFGTALMYLEEGTSSLFKFEQFKVGTFCIAENDQKLVDTVFRWFKLTGRQAKQKFGADSLPKKIQDTLAAKKYDEEFVFVHCVYPNEDYKRGRLGPEGMSFASVYIALEAKQIVSVSGYEEMPYFCLRFQRWGTENEPWGCSPAFETIMEARQLNFVTQFQDALVELRAFPRFLYPDNLDGNIQLAAGSATTYQSDKPEAIPKEWLTQGDNNAVKEMLDDKRKAIEKAFFVNIFTMLEQLADKRMTAYEIAQRVGEKLDQFTGTFDQYVTELINPLVRRGLGIMYRAGRLPDPPMTLMVRPTDDPTAVPELAIPKIQINSRVTLAIRAMQNTGVQNTIQTLEPLIQARPEILDNFNLDVTARNTARAYGMPEKDFNTMKRVIEIRDQRKKQMDEERAMELAQGAAKAGKDLGRSPPALQEKVTQQLTGK